MVSYGDAATNAARQEELRTERWQADLLRIKKIEECQTEVEMLLQLLKDEPSTREALRYTDSQMAEGFRLRCCDASCVIRINSESAKFCFTGPEVREALQLLAERKLAKIAQIKSIDVGVLSDGFQNAGAAKIISALANSSVLPKTAEPVSASQAEAVAKEPDLALEPQPPQTAPASGPVNLKKRPAFTRSS